MAYNRTLYNKEDFQVLPLAVKSAPQCPDLARAHREPRLIAGNRDIALRGVIWELLVQPDLTHACKWRAKGERRRLRLVAGVVEPYDQPIARLGAFDGADSDGV